MACCIMMRGLPYPAIGAAHVFELTSGLKLCLDAGDKTSLPAASTKWLDQSGNGCDFNLSGPSINGSPSGLSAAEYLGFDGNDFLAYDSANEAWMQNLHKDGAKFTICGWINPGSVGPAQNGIIGTNGASGTQVGFQINIRGPNQVLRFGVTNGAGVGVGVIRNMDSVSAFTAGQWQFFAVQVDEAAGTGILQVQGTQETPASSYSSPSASNASLAIEIGRLGNYGGGVTPMTAGSKIAMLWAWEGVALTAKQLMDIYDITRERFGL